MFCVQLIGVEGGINLQHHVCIEGDLEIFFFVAAKMARDAFHFNVMVVACKQAGRFYRRPPILQVAQAIALQLIFGERGLIKWIQADGPGAGGEQHKGFGERNQIGDERG